MEPYPLSPEENREQEKRSKDQRRGFRPKPILRSGGENWRQAEAPSPSPPKPEFHMPVFAIAPEVAPPAPEPHVATLHSEAWLGTAVGRPEYQQPPSSSAESIADDKEEEEKQEPKVPAEAHGAAKTEQSAEDDAFARLLKGAGLDELSRSLHELPPEQPSAVAAPSHETAATSVPRAENSEWPARPTMPESSAPEVTVPAPSEQSPVEAVDIPPPPDGPDRTRFGGVEMPSPAVSIPRVEQPALDSREYIPRAQARTRALVAFAAGLIIGNHYGKKKVRRELTKALEDIEDRLAVNGQQHTFQAGQTERQAYNQATWERRLQRPEQPITVASPTAEYTAPEAQAEGAENPDPFHVEPERHVERDAWHSIVIDKYGHEDLTAREQYGKAFQQEQREVRSHVPADDQGAIGSLMGVAPTTAPTSQPTATNSVVVPELELPAGLTTPQLPSGPSLREDPQHLLPAVTKHGVNIILNPWLWVLIGLLLLVFFAASLFG